MASTLRRRVLGPSDNSSESSSTAPTPRDESPAKPGDKVKIIHHDRPQKMRKRRNTFIFLLGSLFGLIAAGLLAKNNDLIELPEIGELSMDSFFEVLPAGLITDMKDLVVCLSSISLPFPI